MGFSLPSLFGLIADVGQAPVPDVAMSRRFNFSY
jgi:hypothetical protein